MEYSKNFLYKSLAIFVVVITLLSIYCVFWGPGRNWGASFLPARTMSVSSSDFKYVKPDIALIDFSVVSEGKYIKEISNKNNNIVNSVTNYIEGLKISKDDIKTTNYRIEPIYTQNIKYNPNAYFVPGIYKYRLTQSFEIKVRDFSLVSDIISKLPSFNVNKVDGVRFTIEDTSKYIKDIRKSAFDKANNKAKEMAKDNGVKLGRIIKISTNDTPYYPRYYDYGGSSVGGGVESASNDVNIQPGSKKLQVLVTVQYEIK